MRMPGFTAEAALVASPVVYREAGAPAADRGAGGVQPQYCYTVGNHLICCTEIVGVGYICLPVKYIK